MGVWIETRNQDNKQRILRVTPCMGVWIETPVYYRHATKSQVTPCMGVWIETCFVTVAHG